MAISAVVIVAGGSVALHRVAQARGRARRVPRLTAAGEVARSRRLGPHDHPRRRRPAGSSTSRSSSTRDDAARRRAVRIRQEHARPGRRRARSARHPGDRRRASSTGRDRRSASSGPAVARPGRDRVPGPDVPDRHGAGRGRRRVRPREPGVGRADGDAPPRPRGAGAAGSAGRAASGRGACRAGSSSDSRWPACSPRARASSSSTSRRRTSIRPGARRLVAIAGARCGRAIDDDRPDRAPRSIGAWPLADVVLALGPDGRPIDVGPPDDGPGPIRGGDARGGHLAAGGRRTGDRLRSVRRRSRDPRRGPRCLRRQIVRFGYERDEPGRSRCRSLDAAAGRTARARRAERQRQVHARPAARRPAPTGPRHASTLTATTRRGCRRATLARRAGYVFQEPERQFLATASSTR